jgi:predicted branched-subunit amino acid permease
MANERREGRRDVGVFVGCNLAMLAGWTGGTIAGLFAGSAIPDPEAIGLSFLSSAALVSLLAGMWQGSRSVLPWVGAAAASITAHQVMDGYLYILIGAAIGTSIAILPSQRRLDG